ncbi:MAG TPA: flagellar basal-body rod protein FlgG [Tepidisphaeraceae bacterium]|nr:flagellar basal-body rod protein FlgG [Tepidisphaeraceae bacterium]
MAITALHSAASGLRALSTQIDVVANNLANAETTAFKGSRVNFEDLMYLMLKQPGTANAQGDVAPSGIFVGLGTKVDNTQIDLTQGSLEPTNRPLDVAIQGNGFFAVKMMPSFGDGIGYTRNGNFFVNSKNELVLGIGEGYRLVPPLTIPTGVTDINIGQDGTVQVTQPGSGAKRTIGQLQLTQFVNPQGLQLLGGSIYQQTDASGPPINSLPGQQGAGLLNQGFLEQSNVDPVKELVSLIKTQRAFEMNSQSIQTADQALQTVANLRRG